MKCTYVYLFIVNNTTTKLCLYSIYTYVLIHFIDTLYQKHVLEPKVEIDKKRSKNYVYISNSKKEGVKIKSNFCYLIEHERQVLSFE